MSINHEINRLIHFAVQKNLMKEEDRYYAANRLLDVLKVAEFTPEDDIEETLPTATPVLKEMLDYAAGKGLIEDTAEQRDL
ncbi:MAG: galactose-1-phosphate uridylyltransferase, partial [Selenomonadaceae bacterium]|nr:galactose-1-phosphate uridylyltransferase [Selenomonadaceae bacterium]